MISIDHVSVLITFRIPASSRRLVVIGESGLDSEERYIDRIYEAGAIPELWPGVIEELDRIAGAYGTALMVFRDGKLKATGSRRGSELITEYVGAGHIGHDQRTVRLLGANHPGFLQDLDVFTPEEWDADPIRRTFWEPKGFGWGIATGIPVPNGDLMIFHSERRRADGPAHPDVVARLNQLRPHLARAALLSTRMSLERVQAAASALEVIGIPGAVLDRHGRALATNNLLDNLSPGAVIDRPSRLALANTDADAKLQASLAALNADASDVVTQSIPIPASLEHPPMVLHLHPVRGDARDIFSRAMAILVVTPVVGNDAPAAAVIQGLFDLTPAEAKVASAIAAGLTVEAVAAAHRTTVVTVRNQVRSIFAKTGLRRQADLVSLLQGLSPRGG
jgi:DNA-binding CsgD family transcriptional regulator